MEILVLVCALGVAAPDCRRETAIMSFHAPGPQADFSGCLREGLLYAAQSGLVPKDAYPKIVCVGKRPTRVAKQVGPAIRRAAPGTR
jgi:hypothetical protein